MNLWNSLGGMVEGRLVCADPGRVLEQIGHRGIILHGVQQVESLTLTFRLSRKDWKKLTALCEKQGYDLTLVKRYGIYWQGKSLLRRPVLLAGMGFLAALALWLPTRVFFVEVEGNQRIPARQILEAAESCGIRFGASRRAVRSERMKNALLSQMEELKWAGINTAGCRAVISVREKPEESAAPESGVRGIVAARDGFLIQCTVTGGNGLCQPGQTVKAGQLLISPYTDCGICIRVERAEGEIMAQTRRQLRAVTPSEPAFRSQRGQTFRRWWLLAGKNRINFRKCSGIWDATCDRIYKEYYITLPGGFRLPLGVAVETVTFWDTESGQLTPETAETALLAFSRNYVCGKMIAGSILRTDYRMTGSAGLYTLTAEFGCSEMIGREIVMEIGDTNEQADGTDRERGAG